MAVDRQRNSLRPTRAYIGLERRGPQFLSKPTRISALIMAARRHKPTCALLTPCTYP